MSDKDSDRSVLDDLFDKADRIVDKVVPAMKRIHVDEDDTNVIDVEVVEVKSHGGPWSVGVFHAADGRGHYAHVMLEGKTLCDRETSQAAYTRPIDMQLGEYIPMCYSCVSRVIVIASGTQSRKQLTP